MMWFLKLLFCWVPRRRPLISPLMRKILSDPKASIQVQNAISNGGGVVEHDGQIYKVTVGLPHDFM